MPIELLDSLSFTLAPVSVPIVNVTVTLLDNLIISDRHTILRSGIVTITSADSISVSDILTTTINTVGGPTILSVRASDSLSLGDSLAFSKPSFTLLKLNESFNFVDSATPDLRSTGVVTDQTNNIQNLINNTPNGGTVIIDGMQGINANGIRISNRFGITIKGHATHGGGFQYIGAGNSVLPDSSFVYIENCSNMTITDLELNASSKPAAFAISGGSGNLLQRLWVHDIDGNVQPPFAAIRSFGGTNLIVDSCSVDRTVNQCRGIWCGVNDSDYERNITIRNCITHDTGHTGIVSEANGGTFSGNKVYNSLTDGTGYKFIPRGTTTSFLFDGNYVNGTANGGFMVEHGAYISNITVRNSSFNNCGSSGSSFGTLYIVNVQVSDFQYQNNTVAGCRSLGALIDTDNVTMSNTTFGSGNTATAINLEQNDHHIFLTSSGTANIGPGCSDVWVDGVKVA